MPAKRHVLMHPGTCPNKAEPNLFMKGNDLAKSKIALAYVELCIRTAKAKFQIQSSKQTHSGPIGVTATTKTWPTRQFIIKYFVK